MRSWSYGMMNVGGTDCRMPVDAAALTTEPHALRLEPSGVVVVLAVVDWKPAVAQL
jgi:hypothetical protein